MPGSTTGRKLFDYQGVQVQAVFEVDCEPSLGSFDDLAKMKSLG
jgi:hypothetical protein